MASSQSTNCTGSAEKVSDYSKDSNKVGIPSGWFYFDLVNFHEVRSCAHNLELHDRGIVAGLAVDVEKDRVTVQPGIGIDRLGRTLVLETRLDLTSDDQDWPKDLSKAIALGLVATDASNTGDENHPIMEVELTLRFLTDADFQGSVHSLVLAFVEWDASGNPKVDRRTDSPRASKTSPQKTRELVGAALGQIELRRSEYGAQGVSEKVAATLKPRENGQGIAVDADLWINGQEQSLTTRLDALENRTLASLGGLPSAGGAMFGELTMQNCPIHFVGAGGNHLELSHDSLGSLLVHLSNVENPHKVTLDQLRRGTLEQLTVDGDEGQLAIRRKKELLDSKDRHTMLHFLQEAEPGHTGNSFNPAVRFEHQWAWSNRIEARQDGFHFMGDVDRATEYRDVHCASATLTNDLHCANASLQGIISFTDKGAWIGISGDPLGDCQLPSTPDDRQKRNDQKNGEKDDRNNPRGGFLSDRYKDWAEFVHGANWTGEWLNDSRLLDFVDIGNHLHIGGNIAAKGINPEKRRIVMRADEIYLGYWPGDDNLGRDCIVSVSGRFYATNKQFRIDHPQNPAQSFLIHSCLEGPEVGVYYRGEGCLVDGRARVELPAYFEALTRKEGRTVQLTPLAEDDQPISILAASRVSEGAFTVRMVNRENPSQRFYWEVKAVRADVPPLETEVPKSRFNPDRRPD